ncbi:MAG: ATP-binding protein [Coriobacteriia bacterium]|nr:ATP-binding protein [Coriobacteriia bacterium]
MTSADDLLGFVTAVSGETYLKIEENLGDGYVRLRISEAERRQAKHDIRCVEDIVIELLRNSRDAHARRLFLATSREGETRTISIIDDGVGIPDAMLDRVFEPRVTSKLETMVMDQWGVHGRGMALFSIRSNAVQAHVVSSGLHKGTALSVITESKQLPERADQSTWPSIECDDAGVPHVARGPHNIVRRAVEFALEHPGIELFIGTPAEILATISATARREIDSSELLFCDDESKLPVWQRPAMASDAAELVRIAVGLGLSISERTAHRVLAGEVAPLRPVLSAATRTGMHAAPAATPDIYRDRRGLRIHPADLAEFQNKLEEAFDLLAERYYVHLRSAPRITLNGDDLRVRFELEKDD